MGLFKKKEPKEIEPVGTIERTRLEAKAKELEEKAEKKRKKKEEKEERQRLFKERKESAKALALEKKAEAAGKLELEKIKASGRSKVKVARVSRPRSASRPIRVEKVPESHWSKRRSEEPQRLEYRESPQPASTLSPTPSLTFNLSSTPIAKKAFSSSENLGNILKGNIVMGPSFSRNDINLKAEIRDEVKSRGSVTRRDIIDIMRDRASSTETNHALSLMILRGDLKRVGNEIRIS